MARKHSGLRLVREESREISSTPPTQAPLFLSESVLAFVAMRSMTAQRLSYLLNLRPARIIDCRSAPRFDYGLFNRGVVFRLFKELRIDYTDIGPANQHPPSDIIGVTGSVIASVARIQENTCPGATMLLCEDTASTEAIAQIVPKLLTRKPAGGWQVALL